MDPFAINPINGNEMGLGGAVASPSATDDGGDSFAKTLGDAFDNLNSLQNKADDMSTAYANHETSDIHSVMMASEEASIALQMATQVRNKVVDAYQTIMQMQM